MLGTCFCNSALQHGSAVFLEGFVILPNFHYKHQQDTLTLIPRWGEGALMRLENSSPSAHPWNQTTPAGNPAIPAPRVQMQFGLRTGLQMKDMRGCKQLLLLNPRLYLLEVCPHLLKSVIKIELHLLKGFSELHQHLVT